MRVKALLSLAVVVAALTFAGASQAAGGGSSYGPTTLKIVTVPSLAGVHFAFDGKTYVSGRRGTVKIETAHGTHSLRLLDTRVNSPGVRSTFSRWSDNQYTPSRNITIGRNTIVWVGFQQTVRVSFGFADLSGRPVVGRVSRMTLSNTLGSRMSFEPSFPQWLRATGLARRFTGLEPTDVQYSIESALVGGSNVVNQSQQRFYPERTRRVTARLLLYSARVTVRDFLFGTSSGSQLDLVYPSGTSVPYALHGRPLFFSSLPRGTYQVKVHAGGYVPAVSLALSKNQALDVKVVSYLDMFVLLVAVLAAVSVLIIVPRPFLRLRLRSLGSGRRPEPDDLEPPKPLSRKRKKTIFRYMPEPDPAEVAEGALRAAQRLPQPAPSPVVVPDGGESVERPLRDLPARSLETAAATLRKRRERLPAVPGRSPHEPPVEALTGERIELINVYMQDQIAPVRDTEPPPPETPQPEAVPSAPVDESPVPAEPSEDATAIPAAMLAPVIELRPAPAVEEAVPEPVEADAPEPVEELPAAAVEESPAPPKKRAAPARRKRAAPAAEEPAAEKSAAAAPKRTPARRKPAAAKAKTTTSRSTRTRATAKKSTTAAKPKATTSKKATTAKRATTAKKATTAKTTTSRRPRRTAASAKSREAAAAANGGASSDALARLGPDLAAAVEALQEDVETLPAPDAEGGAGAVAS